MIEQTAQSVGSKAQSVYKYYDADEVLLYVGITQRNIVRNMEHQAKEWWPFVVRQEVEHFQDRLGAGKRERELIRAHCPPFNVQHNTDAGPLREMYLQLRQVVYPATPLEEVFRSIRGGLPLFWVGRSQRLLRTDALDPRLAIFRMMGKGVQVRFAGESTPIGFVTNVERRGQMLLLTLPRALEVPAGPMKATFKITRNKAPVEMTITGVVASIPENMRPIRQGRAVFIRTLRVAMKNGSLKKKDAEALRQLYQACALEVFQEAEAGKKRHEELEEGDMPPLSEIRPPHNLAPQPGSRRFRASAAAAAALAAEAVDHDELTEDEVAEDAVTLDEVTDDEERVAT